MKISAKEGLLWAKGEVIPLPYADWVAQRHGFVYCEQMVRAMEAGKYTNPVEDKERI